MVELETIQEQLLYRQRLLDVLVAQDAKIRTLFVHDDIETQPTIEHIPALVEFRDALHLTKDEYEAEEKKIGGWMTGALKAGGIPKWESTTHVVQIMNPPDRVSIDAEVLKTELVLAGVPIDKIVAAVEKATKRSPVASFIRVDRRRGKK